MTSELFNYTDYRSFLKGHMALKKGSAKNFSYGVWAKKMGIDSTAVLTNIINGKRAPGPKLQKKLIDYFKFTAKEAQYFADLIKLSKVRDDPRLALALKEKMQRMLPDGKTHFLDDKSFSAISHWYYYALREMILLPSFVEDYDWMAEKLHFKVTAREVKKAIDDLISLGLIRRSDEGRLVPTSNTLKTTEDLASEGLKRFHEQMVGNAKEAIRLIPVTERDISGRTINIDESKLPEIKQLIREFRDKLSDLYEENPGNRTYQLNIQLFPLTKKERDYENNN